MKRGRLPKVLSIFLSIALVISMFPSLAFGSDGDGNGAITIEPVASQKARVIVASDNGGVDWGNEPIVLTLRTNPIDVQFSVAISPRSLLDASFSGVHGNVLTLTPRGKTGIASVTVTATKDGASASTSFPVQINKYEDTGEYEWGDMQIPGGGNVTGLVFHPNVPNILYCRVDVSGVWRFNFDKQEWISVTDWIRDGIAGSPAQVLGLAIDPDPARASYVYMVHGGSGTVVRSTDFGETWVRLGNTGGSGAGNSNGRGLGERMIVLPGDGQTMFYAGVNGGLRTSTDGGLTWTGVTLAHNNGVRNTTNNETVMGFVNYDPANPNFIVASTAGQHGNPVNAAQTRGASIFYSKDRGATFQELPYQPLPGRQATSGSVYYGYMGVNSSFTKPEENGNRYMYITYTDTHNTTMSNEGQGVDGGIFRYTLNAAGDVLDYRNVTPTRIDGTIVRPISQDLITHQFGASFGGVTVDPQTPGVVMVSMMRAFRPSGDRNLYERPMDTIFRSTDHGETWFPVLYAGYNQFGNTDPIADVAPYLRPLMEGQHNNDEPGNPWEPWWTTLHRAGSIHINPFDSNMLAFNTGMGTFFSYNVRALDHINQGVPHMTPVDGLTPLQGLFTQENGVVTGLTSSPYTHYRIGNSINNLTAEQSVTIHTVRGLSVSVGKEGGLYSPPSGDVIVHSIWWDHGGFAHKSLDHDPNTNYGYPQYIPEKWRHLSNGEEYAVSTSWFSGRNASFAALNPDIVVAALSGDSHWNNTNGIVISFDNANSFSQIPDGWAGGADRAEYGLGVGQGMPTTATTNAVNSLKSGPDQNSGHVIVTADGSNVLWSIGNLNIDRQVYTEDYGQTWNKVAYFNSAGDEVTSGSTYFVADHVNPNIVYAFMASTTLYVSQDGGKTFQQATTQYGTFPTNALATINGAREIRPDLDYEGVIYVGGNNLWKLIYDKDSNTMSASQVSTDTTVSRYGPGIGVNANKANKALYVYGNKPGAGQQSGFGVWRSLDGGESWLKITHSTDNPSPAGTEEDPWLNANMQFSDVRSVIGDARTFGRVFLSTGNTPRALMYGEMIVNLVEEGALPPSLAGTLEGSAASSAGNSFAVQVGIGGLDAVPNFSTVDVIVNYDPAKVVFATQGVPESLALAEAAIAITRDDLQVLGTAVKPDAGEIRIILSTGGGSVSGEGALFTLTGTVLANAATGVTTISLSDFEIAYENSAYAVADATFDIQIVDKALLTARIAAAQTLFNNAVVGSSPGQYTQGAKDTLQEAIVAATLVLNNATATTEAVSEAVQTLAAAVAAFQANVAVDPTINRSGRVAAIELAQKRNTEATVGTKIGQYSAGAKQSLENAITVATNVRYSGTANQSQVNAAEAALRGAIRTFDESVITLVPGAKQVSVRDLSVISQYWGVQVGDARWTEIEKADILDAGQINIQVLAAVARMILDEWLAQ